VEKNTAKIGQAAGTPIKECLAGVSSTIPPIFRQNDMVAAERRNPNRIRFIRLSVEQNKIRKADRIGNLRNLL